MLAWKTRAPSSQVLCNRPGRVSRPGGCYQATGFHTFAKPNSS
ncbi:MAG: hypothetical protein RLZZ179_600 [Verrucomicrobiota bacterium]|jgi:hypothetical protein